MSAPMDERTTRIHLLERARTSGYEQPIRDILTRVDEALKHCRGEQERQVIVMQGLSEIDSYFIGGCSNLNGTSISNIDQNTIDKFNKR